MNQKLMKILRCPSCSGRLALEKPKKNSSGDIYSGLLACCCGKNYPIVNGVPVMLLNLPKNIKKLQKGFSRQWKVHEYHKTKTWRRTTEQRKSMFFMQMGLKNKAPLKNKLLLDAGCGNGELTIALSEHGFNYVVGIDFSDSVFIAHKINKKKGRVFFVQADIMNPPFEKKTFDYVYSDGVVHYMPDTRTAFCRLASLTKSAGRFWAWIYLHNSCVKDNKFKLFLYDNTRFFLSRSPSIFQFLFIKCIALPVAILFQWLGIFKTKDSWREQEILIRNGFTTYDEHKHTPKEVKFWFNECGFRNIKISDTTQLYGFGTYGIKI